MKLEDQVCSLEYAKKLKELGVKQESCFYWSKPFDSNNYYTGDKLEISSSLWLQYNDMEEAKVYSAFTVAELGKMLPKKIKYKPRNGCFGFAKIGTDSQRLFYEEFSLTEGFKGICESLTGSTEANARAKMLVRIIENEYVTIEEINKNMEGLKE